MKADGGGVDVGVLKRLFGHHEVSVHDARGTREDMTLADYADWWLAECGVAASREWKYLKDWHLAHLEPDYQAYHVPDCLGGDWLNEHWMASTTRSEGGDHRFVYVGPAGSCTSLHADVLFSYSWSTNVVGTKRWLLVPSEHRGLVSDASTRPLAADLSTLRSSSGEAVVAPVEVIQRAGELLFVPSGWYHQVENVTECISINHNWLNAHNVSWALERISQVLVDVQHGLGEGEADDAELCESIVSRRCGMGVGELCDLLEGVIERRRCTPSRATNKRARNADGADRRAGCSASFELSQAIAVLAEAVSLLETSYSEETLSPERLAALQRQKQLL